MSKVTGDPVYLNVASDVAFIFNAKDGTIRTHKRKKCVDRVKNEHFKTWVMEKFESPSVAIRRIYLLLCMTYSQRIQRNISQFAYSMNDPIVRPIKEISGPSCVPVNISPGFTNHIPYDSNIGRVYIYFDLFNLFWAGEFGYMDVPCPIRDWDVWRENRAKGNIVAEEPRCCDRSVCVFIKEQIQLIDSPLDHLIGGFVSGGSGEGIINSLKKSVRQIVRPPVDTKYILSALVFIQSKLPPISRVPRFTEKTLDELNYRKGTSAGYFPVEEKTVEVDDLIIKWLNTGKQKDAFDYSKDRVLSLVRQVRDGVEKKVIDPKWFPLLISKISAKVETKKKGDDPMKTRLIFIACMVHLLIDKVLYKEYLEKTYMRCGNMITHKWRRGGAEYIARKFGYHRNDMFYFTFDVINFDQAAFACLIELILLLPLFAMPIEDTSDYKVARAMFMQRAHEMAVKIVKWIDNEYRLIIGQVFSGLFVTSWIDTFYMIISDLVAKQVIYDHIRDYYGYEQARDFQQSFMPSVNYGDDAVRGFEMRYLDIVCKDRTPEFPLGDYQRALKSCLNIDMKPSQTFLFLPDDTGINPFLTLIEVEKRDGIPHRSVMIREGPQFLHRYFVYQNTNWGGWVMPWRHESDYYARIAVSPVATELEPIKWRSKFLGLMIDTMATNLVAYRAMRAMFVASTNLDKRYSRIDEMTRSANNMWGSSAFEMLQDLPQIEDVQLCIQNMDDRLEKVFYRTGLNERDASRSLSPKLLYSHFVWDDEWRNAWAATNGYEMYDLYGNVVPAIWQNKSYTPEYYLSICDESG